MTEQVDFYLLEAPVSNGKLKLACRLTNKLANMEKRIALVCDSIQQIEKLDTLLWQFSDTSFIPHQIVDKENKIDHQRYRVHLLKAEFLMKTKSEEIDVIVNLSGDLLPDTPQVSRRAELVECDETDKQAARNRYKHYRDNGFTTNMHSITL
jgi:DNA polymerase III subunit chi